jgi:hypothetical protein
MSSSQSLRILGGMGAIVSGVLFFLAHFLNLFGKSDFGTVLGASLVFTAHLVVVFAFVGLYVAQDERSDRLGMFGMALGIVGTVMVCAVANIEIAGASGVDVSFVLNSSIPNIIKAVGSLAFVLGMIAFGISTMRNKMFPRLGGILLIVGTVVFCLGSFFVNAGLIFSFIGGACTGLGFLWLGVPLLLSSMPKTL